jgi:hypothetical protein
MGGFLATGFSDQKWLFASVGRKSGTLRLARHLPFKRAVGYKIPRFLVT